MEKIFWSLTLLLNLLIGILAECAAQKQYELHVSAGAFDRSETLVSFYFPDHIEPGSYRLENSSGQSTVL